MSRWVRLKPTLGLISIVVYTLGEALKLLRICSTSNWTPYGTSLPPPQDTLLWATWAKQQLLSPELSVGPHLSGNMNVNRSLLDSARPRRMRNACSWDWRSELHHWTWYSNAEGIRNKIHHILTSTHWRISLSCRILLSAEFFASYHTPTVTTLKGYIK